MFAGFTIDAAMLQSVQFAIVASGGNADEIRIPAGTEVAGPANQVRLFLYSDLRRDIAIARQFSLIVHDQAGADRVAILTKAMAAADAINAPILVLDRPVFSLYGRGMRYKMHGGTPIDGGILTASVAWIDLTLPIRRPAERGDRSSRRDYHRVDELRNLVVE